MDNYFEHLFDDYPLPVYRERSWNSWTTEQDKEWVKWWKEQMDDPRLRDKPVP